MARELAARSVRARRRKAEAAKEAAESKAPKDSAELVKELAKVFVDLRSGRLNVALGRAMASVATVILKGWEQTAIREELRQLREMINETRHANDAGRLTLSSTESDNEKP